jgi:hypothetical protein
VIALGIFIGAGAACTAIQDALSPPYAGGAPSLPWWTAIAVSLIVTLWLSRLRALGCAAASPDVPRT